MKKLSVLMALLAIVILPACGKSKNDPKNGIGIAGAGVYSPGVVPTNGGCVSVSPTGSTVRIYFSGNASASGYTGINADLRPASSMNPTGTRYQRNSYDYIDLYANGNSMSGYVDFRPETISWVVAYGGSQICGVYLQNSGISNTGMILNNVRLITAGSQLPL